LLQAERQARPGNLIPVFLENYMDFLTLFTVEDSNLFETLKSNKDDRLNRLEQGDPASPWYLYTRAEVYLQWGFTRVRFKEYVKALFELRKAYKLLEENAERFPDFMANKKTLGMMHVLLSTVPDQYQWAVRLFGLNGNLSLGKQELRNVLAHAEAKPFVFEPETAIIYATLLLLVEKKEQEAWVFIQERQLPEAGNVMSHFAAVLVALYSGHNDQGIAWLINCPNSAAYEPYPYLDFLLGLAKLRRNDPDADIYFKRFLSFHRGQRHIKDANQKLAWFYLLHDDTARYYEYMRLVETEGADLIDADKQALKEAETDLMPDKQLLEARLLADGGYHRQAIEVLEGVEAEDFEALRFQVECCYRKGRIYDQWGKTEQAIPFYLKTIEKGANQPWYYAANAALHLAYIFESQQRYAEARQYYHICLNTDDHEYKNSLDQKAKAGLSRIKGKG